MTFTFLPEYRDKIKWFELSPDAGDPSCICSLCEEIIGEQQVPIRLFDANTDLEARFHMKCFGTATGAEIHALPDDEELL